MLIFETSGRFPFRTMRLLGWTLITLGFVLLVLDITDVAYTAANFGDDDCEVADYPGWDKDPCKHDDHIYCYIASGIWSSIVIIITGIMGARFSKWNIRHLRFQRDLFAVMAVLCALLFVPAVLALHAVEMVKLKDMGAFYYEDGDLKTRDEAKFALPMVILMIASLIFLVAAMTVIISCCCAPVNDSEENVFSTAPDAAGEPSPALTRPPDAVDAAIHAANQAGRSTVRTRPVDDRPRQPRARFRRGESWGPNYGSVNGYPGPYMYPEAQEPQETSFTAHPMGHSAGYPGQQQYMPAQPPHTSYPGASQRAQYSNPYPQGVFWAPADSVSGGRYRRRQTAHPYMYSERPNDPPQQRRHSQPYQHSQHSQEADEPSGSAIYEEPSPSEPPPAPPAPRPGSGYPFPTPQTRMPSTVNTPDGPSYYMGAIFNDPDSDQPVTHVFDSTA